MTLSYEDHVKGTKSILEESQKEKEKYKISILGKNFIVYPYVFSPKYFHDTEFFAQNIPIKKEEKFLEIGSGTGVISIFAILKGASSVVAIDINEEAVKNTKENAEINQVKDRIEVLYGDVFSPLKENDKFDTIFWNVPFGYTEEDKISIIEKAIIDPYYNSIKRFISEARNHLKPNSHLLIGFSTTLGKFDILKKIIEENKFKIKLIAKTKSTEVYPVYLEIFEAVLV